MSEHLTRDLDTGLAGAAGLLAALGGDPSALRCLEIMAIGAPAGIEEPFMLASDPGLGPRVGAALTDAAVRQGGRAFRLGGTVYAMLVPGRVPAGAAASSARAALADVGWEPGGGLLHGHVAVPIECSASVDAVRLAYRRMRARAAWHPLGPGRQVRDVLLQLLSERLPPGDQARRPQVTGHAVAIGRRVGHGTTDLDALVRAAELQDVGMLALPSALLEKRAPLTPAEWAIIRHHPIAGERIIAAAPALANVARIVRSCYERFDGTGYPDRLRAEAIPLSARIIAVCVAFDAMTSWRPYRAPLTASAALAELRRCARTQFDPRIVALFHEVVALPESAPRPKQAA